MGTLRVLNLYAGIGGNRKLWPGHVEVTAVELDPKIGLHVFDSAFNKKQLRLSEVFDYG
jgi:DNA (cytosine-5)-methyltransferase 1